MKILKKKRVELGIGHITQYTIFESKRIGGIWIYDWKSIEQNRFHTHAFNSYAFLLSGSYTEEVIHNGIVETRVVNQKFKPRFLPKHYCHRILKAEPNTYTIVFFGKWIPYWWEYFSDSKIWVQYGWGRKVMSKIEGDEKTKLKS